MDTRTASPAPIASLMDAPPPRGLFARMSRLSLHMKRCQEESLRDLDLSYSDYIVLGALRTEGGDAGLSASQLANLVLRPKGSITLILDRLEKAELIRRVADPQDRRALLIQLTEKGRRFALEGAAAFDRIQTRVLSALEPDSVDGVDLAIRQLLAAFDQDQQEETDGRAPQT